MTGNKVIFGLSGLIASGKGTAAKYLEKKYQAGVYSFSMLLIDLANRLYLPNTRDNLVKLSECLRTTFGEDVLAKSIMQDVSRDSHSLIVVEAIRRLADIEYLKKLPGFVLIEIFADPKIRYERLIRRGEKPDDTTKTYEQFVADHQRSTELSIPDVTAQAAERLDNNGDLINLYQQIDALVNKYKEF